MINGWSSRANSKIMVGASSSDIKLTGKIEVVGENRILEGDWQMESHASVEVQT